MVYYKKCSVCGKIWSYTTEDIEKNKANATQGVISAIGSIASVFGGTRLDTYALNNAANNSLDKVIDYDKCPNCGSLKSVQIEYSALGVPPIRNRIPLVRDSVPPCFYCCNPRDNATNPYNDTDSIVELFKA